MKNILIFCLPLMLMIVFEPFYGEAQLINYKRLEQRRKKMAEKALPAKGSKQNEGGSKNISKQTGTKELKTLDQQLKDLLNSRPKATNRIEKLYDYNYDQLLQEEEIKDLLRDVVSSAERKGSFEITSPVLKIFDLDQDGLISQPEAADMKKLIN